MKGLLCILLMCFVCVGSVEARNLTKREQAMIKDTIGDYLFDDVSARYKFGDYQGGLYYCGRLNAKNRDGNYMGYKIFLVSLLRDQKSNHITSVNFLDMDTKNVAESCNQLGYKLLYWNH